MRSRTHGVKAGYCEPNSLLQPAVIPLRELSAAELRRYAQWNCGWLRCMELRARRLPSNDRHYGESTAGIF